VRIEAEAVADELGVRVDALTTAPDGGRFDAETRELTRQLNDAYEDITRAAAEYLRVQARLRRAVTAAEQTGVPLPEAPRSWLDTPPEQALATAGLLWPGSAA